MGDAADRAPRDWERDDDSCNCAPDSNQEQEFGHQDRDVPTGQRGKQRRINGEVVTHVVLIHGRR